HSAVGTHRQGGSELGLVSRTADAHGQDFYRLRRTLADAQGLLQGNGIERVEDKGQAVHVNARPTGLDAKALIRIGYALGWDEDLHGQLAEARLRAKGKPGPWRFGRGHGRTTLWRTAP